MPCLASFYQYRDAILLPNVNKSQYKDWNELGPSHDFHRGPFCNWILLQVANAFTVYSIPSAQSLSLSSCPSKFPLHPGNQDKVSFMRF